MLHMFIKWITKITYSINNEDCVTVLVGMSHTSHNHKDLLDFCLNKKTTNIFLWEKENLSQEVK